MAIILGEKKCIKYSHKEWRLADPHPTREICCTLDVDIPIKLKAAKIIKYT